MSLDITLKAVRPVEVYSDNITHNLIAMAEPAGLYQALWHPEQLGIKTAAPLIPILKKGLEDLENQREYFKQFNPTNGWGTYEGLVRFVEGYLAACEKNPDAEIEVSR